MPGSNCLGEGDPFQDGEGLFWACLAKHVDLPHRDGPVQYGSAEGGERGVEEFALAWVVDAAGQGQVEAHFFGYVGVAPEAEQPLLV